MKAEPLLHEKRVLINSKTNEMAIAELKVWKIPKSKSYPEGQKYSLFLVSDGKVVFGMDNHKPKGPHIHVGEEELPYIYSSMNQLVDDFWEFVKKAGFK